MQYRTRIAPSPTGFAHIGTFRTAYFCWLAARATNGTFILRLDNTDVERNVAEAEQPIYDGLEWLGLEWDEFYKQSNRLDLYRIWADQMLKHGFAVRADNGAIIMNWHDFMPRSWADEIAGEIPVTQTNIEQIDGKTVLMRGGDKLGQPTYQFTTVVDDYTMGVNYIIRGTDHISNSGKQLAIWSALCQIDGQAYVQPKMAHVGLIFKDKKKMSKRDGAASLLQYRDEGYEPEAILNFLLRMGWGPTKDDKTNAIIPRDKAVQMFLTEGRMRNVNAGYDGPKLAWFQKQYSKMKEAA